MLSQQAVDVDHPRGNVNFAVAVVFTLRLVSVLWLVPRPACFLLQSQPSSDCLQECKAAKSEKFPEIPWDMQKVIEVMTLWMFLFFLVGGQTATMVPRMLGTESLRLATYGHALGYCICDLTNLLLTITVITQSVRPHRFWRMGLFDVRPTGSTFLWVLASCLTFPIIDRLSHVSQMWFIAADGISSPLEQSITYGNAAANVLYFFVVSICTPIWEEAIFRGFLLSSLTKYMPALAATAVSSLAFTVAHFSFQRSLYLAVLGFIFGYTFVRTRNLMTPILIHSLWNFYVFWKVFCLPPCIRVMRICNGTCAMYCVYASDSGGCV